jgi:ATP-dependent DNA helicase RecG
MHTQVRWFDDHVVFFNAGGLPAPLQLEDLKKPHPSVPRNRKIAEMFFYIGWIEQWGRGIQKIVDECTAAGLPEPEFEERTGGLWVIFRKDILTEEYLSSLGLNERQIKVVLFVKEKGSITNREYRQLTEFSDESARKDMSELVDQGVLRSEGKGRGVRYVLSKVGD